MQKSNNLLFKQNEHFHTLQTNKSKLEVYFSKIEGSYTWIQKYAVQ